MTKVTYNDFTFDASSAPQASVAALLSRGLAHYLGNEVSARVGSSFKRQAIEAFKAVHNLTEVSAEQRKQIESSAIPSTDSAEYIETKTKIFDEFKAALLDGTVGVRERGATVDPFEAEVAAITKSRVVAILRAERKSADGSVYKIWSERRDPKADDRITLADKVLTFAEALASHGTKHKDLIEKEAKKRLAEREAAKSKAAKSELDDAF